MTAGNEKVIAAAKQLADIKLKKEIICKELCKREGTVKDAYKQVLQLALSRYKELMQY